MLNDLIIKSPSFLNNGLIPKKHTGFGGDISPSFNIENVDENVVSIAIIMDDLDVPFLNTFNHWVIWNIPKTNQIMENIANGENPRINTKYATQGVGWGKNRYRGPKQPIFVRKTHRYKFNFFALDTLLDLSCKSSKEELVSAMEGHILQTGNIIGLYKR